MVARQAIGKLYHRHHPAFAAVRAALRVFAGHFAQQVEVGQRFFRRAFGQAVQFPAAFELFVTVAPCQNPVMAHPHEAFGRYVKQKAAQKLVRAQGHELFRAVVFVIFPGKGDFAVVDALQPPVANRNPVSIAAQVF